MFIVAFKESTIYLIDIPEKATYQMIQIKETSKLTTALFAILQLNLFYNLDVPNKIPGYSSSKKIQFCFKHTT